jgi:cysteine desulfurase/selenocysteine lyase
VSIRVHLPILESMTYVDHAATGVLATPVTQAMQEAIALMAQGSKGNVGLLARVAPTREKLARLIGAQPTEIALLRSTGEGLNTVAAGVRWRPGDNVVTSGIEFPSNVYPWLNLEGRYGVKTRLVPPREGRVLAADLIAACDEQTRVLTVSWVQFANGYRTDLAALGRFCRSRGIRFCVDAIQGLGALALDVERYQIDFLACGAQKWLLGPVGIGFLYVRKEIQGELWPSEVGPGSVVMDPARFLAYDLTFRESAERFESGLPNFVGLFGLEASVSLLLAVGAEAIERQVLALTDQLAAGVVERGYRLRSHRAPEERSGIIAFVSDHQPSQAIHQRLAEAGVVCSLREGAVRLAPHLYNTAAEMEQILKVLGGSNASS